MFWKDTKVLNNILLNFFDFSCLKVFLHYYLCQFLLFCLHRNGGALKISDQGSFFDPEKGVLKWLNRGWRQIRGFFYQESSFLHFLYCHIVEIWKWGVWGTLTRKKLFIALGFRTFFWCVVRTNWQTFLLLKKALELSSCWLTPQLVNKFSALFLQASVLTQCSFILCKLELHRKPR